MSSRTRSSFFQLPAAFAMLAASLLLLPQTHALPCPPEEIAVDVGLQDLAFEDNGDGTFTGTGLAGTFEIDDQGISVHAAGTGNLADAVDWSVRLEGAATRFAPVEGASAGTVRRLDLDSGASTQAAAFTELRAGGLYPGVDLTVSAGQRRLWLTLDAASAQALGAVRLVFSGVDLGLADARTLTLSADPLAAQEGELEFPQRRTSALELVALELTAQGEKRIGASLVLDRDRVSIRFDESPQNPVRVYLTSLLAPHTEPTDVVRTDDGRLFAVTSSRVAAGTGARAGLLHELDADGGKILGSTVLEASGDLVVRGLAEDAAGRLVLVGGRTQDRLTSPVALVLDDKSDKLTELSAVAELDGPIDDVVFDAEGRLFVVGTAGDTFEPVTAPSREFTLALPRVEQEETRRRFIAEISPLQDRLVSALEFQAPLRLERLWAWVDCWGNLHFGLPWTFQARSTDHTYSMTVSSSDMQNCPRIDESHGFGALCWKARKNTPDWTYHPMNVSSSDVPSALVFLIDPTDPGSSGVPDHQRLNELENNQFGNLFYDTTTNQWADPGGGWTHPNNWAYSKVELAVAAAVYHTRWTSPVFANLRVPTDIDPAGVRAVMLREETFSADSTSDLPHNICDEDSDGNGISDFEQTAWPTPFEHQVAGACASAHSSSFTLESITYDTWRVGAAYIPDQTLSGASNAWWPWFTPYVGDPPLLDDDEPGLSDAHLREMSRRLAGSARLGVTLEVTTYSGGSPQGTTYEQGTVRALAME